MGSPLVLEKRRKQRRALTGLLPGSLLNQQGDKVNARPVDISPEGLGIVTDLILDLGHILFLKTHNQHIELEVSWGKRDFGKNNLYRYGLRVRDGSNLETIFESAGCLK
ncbi:PilZ domain-containing protein [Pseudobacteriovorax antillogorgiicola]|uniref:PilZ domain-containing protein n=1 Tax=Pseudobacteriovorax antillogorgiicola TaxID=1513793 RepID=A0A1Y6BUX0_9BACT|nr:PilZ domain-containing protein [Pseudobacteriovorax antillogorgiicola]TCS53860.1 PilZ domain-containing protein [Pseudobacteriovorax antillogorgiicola]SMF21444.1 PilZ domain-containing protein [Pseudobacteriovorax antillogorgiicola]